MSRSCKKPVIKERPRNIKKSTLYWRTIRRHIKNTMKSTSLECFRDLPNPKTIVNDYDYCDYIFRSSNKKHTRK